MPIKKVRIQAFATLLLSLTSAAVGAASPPPGRVDVSRIDVCRAIPEAEVVKALGRKLVERPKAFHLNERKTDSGCSWSAGKDSAKNAYFAYAVVAPAADYAAARLSGARPVAGLGDEAYTVDGADAQQLWVLVKGKGAVMVAIGDEPRPEGAKRLAALLLARLGQ